MAVKMAAFMWPKQKKIQKCLPNVFFADFAALTYRSRTLLMPFSDWHRLKCYTNSKWHPIWLLTISNGYIAKAITIF